MSDSSSKNSRAGADKKHSYKLSREFRLRDRFDFLRLQKNGEKLYAKHFLVSITPSESNCSRLGVAITKKVSQNATDRNKIKRRLKEIFRLNRHKLKGNFDMVVVARRDAQLCTFEEVKREILGALKRGGYLKAI